MALKNTISRSQNQIPARDYAFLREEGIKHLEKLATQLWTDFNSHDPGITLLELLCYAITDLGYRTSLNGLTIFNPAGNAGTGPSESFFTPGEIFSNSPLTNNDFRRILIDQEKIANAWIQKAPPVEISSGFAVTFDKPVFKPDYAGSKLEHVTGSETDPVCNNLNGLKRVVIEFERDLLVTCGENPANKEAGKLAVINQATALLHEHRGLCEDFTFVGGPDGCEEITLHTEIDIVPGVNASDVLAQMLFDIEDFLVPPVKFYSIEELKAKGLENDRIFEGPRLNHGFIWEEELQNLKKREAIFVSDLIQVIMDVKGVQGVNFIEAEVCTYSYSTQTSETARDPWCLFLPSSQKDSTGVPKYPNMDFQLYLADLNLDPAVSPTLNFVSGLSPVAVNYEEAAAKLEQLRSVRKISRLEQKALDIALPEGKPVDLESYYPIQNELPTAYGTGPEGVVRPATDERLAKARQLKTYLMFFEQIIADYFSQLNHASNLLSWGDIQNTYFSQLVQEVADLNNLYDGTFSASDLKALVEDTSGTDYYLRRNKFLDHLMARFSEEMTTYSLLQYAKRGETRLIEDKRRLLKDYRPVSSERGKGFNYKSGINYLANTFTGTDNVTGYQKRACRLVGIVDWRERYLNTAAPGLAEGIHVVEHILLRPFSKDSKFLDVAIGPTEDLSCVTDKDPYSFRITVILPGWLERYQDDYHYRKYIERILRQEAPAHIVIDPKWLSQKDMNEFEICWFKFLNQLAKPSPNTTTLKNLANCVIDVLNNCEDYFDARFADPLEKNEDYYRILGEKISYVIDPVGDPILAVTAVPPIPIQGTPSGIGWGFPSGIKLVRSPGTIEGVPNPLSLGFTQPEVDALVPGDIIVTDPWVLKTGPGVWTPGGIDLPNEAPHGTWQWVINVTNDKGDFSQHRVIIKILNDNEARFTPIIKNIDAYQDGDVIGKFTDADASIEKAFLYKGSSGISKPNWLGFNPVDGKFTVLSASLMRSELPGKASLVGKFYLLSFTVITKDKKEGVTKQTATLKVRKDTEATYKHLKCGYSNSWPNEDALVDGTKLAWVIDPDAPTDPNAIISATQAGGPTLPDWLTLKNNGQIVVNNKLFNDTSGARYVDPIDITITLKTKDKYNGESTIPNVRIKILPDTLATHNQVETRILCLCPGDTVVTFNDVDAPIVSWTLYPGSQLPAGLKFDMNGNIVVSPVSGSGSSYYTPPYYNYSPNLNTKVSTGLEGVALKPWEQQRNLYNPAINNAFPVCNTNLLPGVFNVKMMLIDACGGKSPMDFNIVIRGDRPASRIVPKAKAIHCYTQGVTVVSFTDKDGPIVAAYAKTLPPGLQMHSNTGEIKVSNPTTFQARLSANRIQSFFIHTLDACGGETVHIFDIDFTTSTKGTGSGIGIYTGVTTKAANEYKVGETVMAPAATEGITSARVSQGTLPGFMNLDKNTGELYIAKDNTTGNYSTSKGGVENRAIIGGKTKITMELIDDCGKSIYQELNLDIKDETPIGTMKYLTSGSSRIGQLGVDFSDVLEGGETESNNKF